MKIRQYWPIKDAMQQNKQHKQHDKHTCQFTLQITHVSIFKVVNFVLVFSFSLRRAEQELAHTKLLRINSENK